MALRASLNSHCLLSCKLAGVGILLGVPVAYTRKPQLKLDTISGFVRTTSWLSLPLHVWRKALDALDNLAAVNFVHFGQLCLCALRSASTQVALAAFRAHDFARTCQAKTLGGCLMGLKLGFASFCFAGHY